VFGMVGTTTTTKTVGMTVVANQTDSEAFKITFTGGPDLSSVDALIINYDNQAKALKDDGTSLVGAPTNKDVTLADGPITGIQNKIVIPSDNRLATGNLLKVEIDNSSGEMPVAGHRITIIGVFPDGGQQILWDRTL